jgi:hypothetical protein
VIRVPKSEPIERTFSGSTIKSWFQYRCERKTRYDLFTKKEFQEAEVTTAVKRKSWADTGIKFEDLVVDALDQTSLLRPHPPQTMLDEARTAAFLRRAAPETLAAQANLTPIGDVPFLAGTGLALKRNLPDLIRFGRPEGLDRDVFTIIDIKATRRATAFHKTQVAFYVHVLRALLAEMGLDNERSLDPFGEIWRIPDSGTAASSESFPERFRLEPYLRLVDDFCRKELPEISRKKVLPTYDETFFHLYFKCEECEFIPHCTKAIQTEAAEDRDVSAVAGLSHEGKRALHRLKIRTVGDLAGARGLAHAPGLGWSLTRRAPLLLKRAQAVAAGTIQRTDEEHTYLMPPRADVRLMLSVDHDPVDDRIAAVGYRRVDGGVMTRESIVVPLSGSSDHEAEAMIVVMGALIEDLASIDAANVGLPDGQGLYAHIFFYEPSEARTLQAAIGRHLENPVIRGGLLNLVRLFPPEDIVPEPEFRGMHHLPATAVRSVVEQLFAIPTQVSYDLRQVTEALAREEQAQAYAPEEDFYRAFSSLLSIDVIRPIREAKPHARAIADVEADVGARLAALDGVIAWLYREHQKAADAGTGLLRLAKKPFRFHANFDPLNAVDLDVLLACELLEERAGMLETLIGLAQPVDQRRDAGRCISQMTLHRQFPNPRGPTLLFKVPIASRDAELGPGDFMLILTGDDPDLRLDPTNWPAVQCRILPQRNEFVGRTDLIMVQVNAGVFNGAVFQELLRRTPVDGWCLDRAFNDVNSARAARFLSHLSANAA